MSENILITIQGVESREKNIQKMLKKLPDGVEVYYDRILKSPLNSFFNMLDIKQKDYRLHLQDDIIIPDGFSEYLPHVVTEMKEKDIDVLTLFTPNRKLPKEQLKKGLKFGVFPNYLWLQATIFSKRFTEEMIKYRNKKGEAKIFNDADDIFIQEVLKETGIKAYCHLPSVIQHDVFMGSVAGNANSKRRMSDIYDEN